MVSMETKHDVIELIKVCKQMCFVDWVKVARHEGDRPLAACIFRRATGWKLELV